MLVARDAAPAGAPGVSWRARPPSRLITGAGCRAYRGTERSRPNVSQSPPPPSPLPPPRKCQRECQHVEQVVFCFLQCILPPFCILHLFLNLSVFSKAERQRRTDASGSESAPRSSSCPPSPRWDTLNSRCRRSHDSSLRKDCSTHPPSPFLAPS